MDKETHDMDRTLAALIACLLLTGCAASVIARYEKFGTVEVPVTIPRSKIDVLKVSVDEAASMALVRPENNQYGRERLKIGDVGWAARAPENRETYEAALQTVLKQRNLTCSVLDAAPIVESFMYEFTLDCQAINLTTLGK